MSVVLLLWRTRLRSSWRPAVVLVVFFGLGGGVTLAVTAGARRTASANDAILRAANASDVSGSFGPQHPGEMLPLLEGIPDVDGVSLQVGFIGRLEGPDLQPSTLYFQGLWSDRPAVDRPFVTAGRLPTGPSEVLLNEGAVAATGLGLGDAVTLALARPSTISLNDFGDVARVEVQIVGIGLLPDEVIEDELGGRPLVMLSRALTEAQLDRRVYTVAGLSLLRQDLAAVAKGLAGIQSGDGSAAMVIERVRANDRARVQTAVRPLVGAFAGFAALAGITTAVVAPQALGRLLRRRTVDDQALEAVGCTRRQLVAADLASAATVATGGVAVALVAAVAASPLFPVGPARRVRDVVRSFDVDVAALGLGATLLVGAVLTLVGLSSWRRRSWPARLRPGPAPGVLGAGPARSAGLRLIIGRPGVRSTVAGVAAGLAAILATLTFTGSLDRLAGDADLSGMSWDVVARENFTQIDQAFVAATVRGDPTAQRATTLAYTYGGLDGAQLPGAQLAAVTGDPWPPIADGRAPQTSREILVGTKTLGALDLAIGDEVELSLVQDFALGARPEPRPMTVTVVGSAVIPAIGQAGIGTPRLSQGFLVSPETVDAILGEGGVLPFIILFDLAPGADARALIDRFPAGLPDSSDLPTEWFTSAVPAEVRQAEDARPVIWMGVAALAVAVVATIGHTLLSLVRQRRRDYAVLKAIGFTTGQIRATVLWQSGAVLAVALIGAVPVGVAAGRWLWIAFAEDLGILVRPVVPVLLLGAAVAVAVLVVQGAALVPATLARRAPPGQALHAE